MLLQYKALLLEKALILHVELTDTIYIKVLHIPQEALEGRRSEVNICRKLISNNNHFKEITCLWTRLCVTAFGIQQGSSLSPLPILTDKCSKEPRRILTNSQLVYVLEIRMPKLYLLILLQSELSCYEVSGFQLIFNSSVRRMAEWWTRKSLFQTSCLPSSG